MVPREGAPGAGDAPRRAGRPRQALVALAEGGYGLEVADGAARRYVRVETGLFAEGMVEVSGDGLAEGMRVVVPR
ncbi:MAG: hypothetical protein ACR2G7_13870 [Acidimicrobiales bacterium]